MKNKSTCIKVIILCIKEQFQSILIEGNFSHRMICVKMKHSFQV